MTMTYTLDMAGDQRIKNADDGVAEVPMTDARAALTPLIREVSWGGRVGAFTERKKRVAMLVPPDFYEQALRDRTLVEELEKRAADPSPDAKPDVRNKARVLREFLTAVRQAWL